MSELVLTGLDGKNPIAFLAALGVLNAATEATRAGSPAPRLAWRQTGTFLPVLVDGPDRSVLLDVLWKDVQAFRAEPAIEGLRYRKEGGAEAHDLKPPPGRFAEYLRGLVEASLRRERSRSTCAAWWRRAQEEQGKRVEASILRRRSPRMSRWTTTETPSRRHSISRRDSRSFCRW